MKVKWYERVFWKIEDWFESWIYPGYYLGNFLFKRYDLIRLPGVKSYQYLETDERILLANMQLLCDFLEKENPEKYICWYEDESGEDCGHKYGELNFNKYVYPEMNGKWVMDILKDIYHWWKVERPQLLEDEKYLLDIWATYINGEMVLDDGDDEELSEIKFDKSKCCSSLEEFDKVVDWTILDKYLDGDRKNILVDRFLFDKMHELKNHIWNEDQKNLHLLIDVRYCLWT